MSEKWLEGKRILIVDDDTGLTLRLKRHLEEASCYVVCARSVSGACKAVREALKKSKGPFHIALIDILIPEKDRGEASEGGGTRLADLLRGLLPDTMLVGMSQFRSESNGMRLSARFVAFIEKSPAVESVIIEAIERLLGKRRPRGKPKVFIVHGHDRNTTVELKNYIQNTLRFDEPVILCERPSLGRTIIEKFEQEIEEIDLVFVLLTPDDKGFAAASPEAEKQRARQNVIFELGYFYGKLGRTTGRILLLRKGEIEFPSDLSGIIYIEIPDTSDIRNAIRAAGEDIRLEIPEWFPPS